MTNELTGTGGWWATGLLFESCSCQLVCPGHIHFEQLCTHERCKGYWAFQFDGGRVGGVELGGVRAVVAFDSPQRMVDGGWSQVLILDEDVSSEQRGVLDDLFAGRLGGPWAILGRFVSNRQPTRVARIDMELEPTRKNVRIGDLLESTVTAIRGRNRSQPVRFENIFNQIHAPTQTIARANARYDDGTIQFETNGTHGLWSEFEWNGP